MNISRTSFALTACGAFILCACRVPVHPEAGLSAATMHTQTHDLATNGRSEWIVVLPDGELPDLGVAVLTRRVEQGRLERALMYTVRRGPRSAELLPLSPVGATWWSAAVEEGAAVLLPERADEIPRDGVLGPVGWMPEGAQTVTWLGALPDTAAQWAGVALDAKIAQDTRSLHEVVDAALVLDLEDGSVAEVGGESYMPRGQGVWVRLDGARVERPYRVLAPRSAPLDVASAADLTVVRDERAVQALAEASREHMYGPQLRLLSEQLGVDGVLVVRSGEEAGAERLEVGHAEPGTARLGASWWMPLAVGDEPLELAPEADLLVVLRGLKDARDGHPLRAMSQLAGQPVRVHHNAFAASLRVQELAGAAGMAQWVRRAVWWERTHAQAPEYLYIGRALLLEGSASEASKHFSLARTAFTYWIGGASRAGQARALSLLSVAQAAQGDWAKALESAKVATQEYKDEEDWVGAARAARFGAMVAIREQRYEDAEALAKNARSLSFHGGDELGCADAELLLAELFERSGDPLRALEMAELAGKRMVKLGAQRGLLRARITRLVVLLEHKPTQVTNDELEAPMARLRDADDPVSVMNAAAGIVNAQRFEAPAEIVELGVTLLDGRKVASAAPAALRADAALAALCAQGLARYVSKAQGLPASRAAEAEAVCQTLLGSTAASPYVLDSWLERGHAALQMRRWEDVDELLGKLVASRAGELVQNQPQRAARIDLFHAQALRARATVAPEQRRRALERQAEKLEQRAVETMDEATNRALKAKVFLEWSTLARARAMPGVSAEFVRRALRAGLSQEQEGQVYAASMRMVRAYEEMERWGEAEEAIVYVRPIVAKTKWSVEGQEHLALHQQYVGRRRGGPKVDFAGFEKRWRDFGVGARMRLVLEAGVLAGALGERREAARLLRTVRDLEDGLEGSLTDTPRGRQLEAKALILNAELAAMRGDVPVVATSSWAAVEVLAEDPTRAGLELRARALWLSGRWARSDVEYDRAANELALSRIIRDEDLADALATAARYSAELALMGGSADSALAVIDELASAGYAAGRTPQDAACLLGIAQASAGSTQGATLELMRACNGADGRTRLSRRAAFWGSMVLGARETRGERLAALEKLAEESELTDPERERLVWMQRPFARSSSSERAFRRLERAWDASQKKTGAEQAHAGEACVQYWLDAGDIGRAAAWYEVVEPVLAVQGPEQRAVRARLALRLALENLDVVRTRVTPEVLGLSEDEAVSAAERAALHERIGQVMLARDAWQGARHHLSRAVLLHDASRDPVSAERVRSFAKRFELPTM